MMELHYHKQQQLSLETFSTSLQGNFALLQALHECSEALVLCEINNDSGSLHILHVNKGWEIMSGLTRKESLLNDLISILQGKGTSQSEVDIVRTAVKRREATHAKLLCYHKNQVAFWNSLRISFTGKETKMCDSIRLPLLPSFSQPEVQLAEVQQPGRGHCQRLLKAAGLRTGSQRCSQEDYHISSAALL
ncbi:hypothetical protein CYMTET_23362 [Cymbomonas tetramitiformis]|uniref:PAS domain-containing protein n=1 Tax=Cymbomonas tetramitiformis TaxID=36881 RepID=A0AAE0FZI1_9CHLO|nr:hypothetical protein CYMTET_23362 [Cymbomonas tetramitiformis]